MTYYGLDNLDERLAAFLPDDRGFFVELGAFDGDVALANCKARGGNVSIGAVSRYNMVRKVGDSFFDADLTKAGIQASGERPND